MRRFTILWFISLLLIMVMIFFTRRADNASLEKYIDQQVKQSIPVNQEQQLPSPLHGKDGKDGVTTVITKQDIQHEIVTLPGMPGRDGIDGKNGKDGIDGKDGRNLEIQVNPESGNLETKYTGDVFWQVLVPCERLLKSCEANK